MWWPKSGIAGREWNGREEEASRLKSTLIGAIPPEADHSHDEECCRSTALRNVSGGGRAAWARPGGPSMAGQSHTLKCGPWSSGRRSLVKRRTQILGWFSYGRKENNREGFYPTIRPVSGLARTIDEICHILESSKTSTSSSSGISCSRNTFNL